MYAVNKEHIDETLDKHSNLFYSNKNRNTVSFL